MLIVSLHPSLRAQDPPTPGYQEIENKKPTPKSYVNIECRWWPKSLLMLYATLREAERTTIAENKASEGGGRPESCFRNREVLKFNARPMDKRLRTRISIAR